MDAHIRTCQVNDVVLNSSLSNFTISYPPLPSPLGIVRVEGNLGSEVVLGDSQAKEEELSKADGQEVVDRFVPQKQGSRISLLPHLVMKVSEAEDTTLKRLFSKK